eukprot:TRINITY_DN3627_c0_g1_i1.p1 TRINITY_DN3627_c0_g1~~TRINITY_DN3627_c0_g1_i1.p1  ORF type:complete len:254 (+),score=27.15 TRINITY_DN3627_c0_g1_i1:1-762(+)
MARLEYLTPEGLRLDGRRPLEVRTIRCKIGLFSQADGSAYVEMGNTKVLASVYGPREVSMKSRAEHDKAILSCEFSMATFSTGERRRKGKGDRRTAETGLLIRKAFESVILTHLFPSSQINLYVQVLQADGGELCAGINAISLAVMEAGIPMRGFVVACAAGYLAGTPMADPNYTEESVGGADLAVALLPKSGKVRSRRISSPCSSERVRARSQPFISIRNSPSISLNVFFTLLPRDVAPFIKFFVTNSCNTL